MHPLAQLALIGFILLMIFVPRGKLGGKSFYWYVFSRFQWSVLELWSTLIVGTIPIAIVTQSSEMSGDLIKETAGIILLGGLILSFIGSAFGLMIANFLKIKLQWKRFICLLAGWACVILILFFVIVVNKPDFIFG